MKVDFHPRSVDCRFEIPRQDYKNRIAKLRGALSERGIDFGIAFGTPSLPGDLLYLTGYEPQLENALVLVSEDHVVILGGPEGEAYALEQIKVGQYRVLSELRLPDEDYPNTRFADLSEVIREVAGTGPATAALLTDPGIFPISWETLLQVALGPQSKIIRIPEVLGEHRAVKSAAELQAIAYAALISAEGMRAMLASFSPGLRELELAAAADHVMKKMGAASVGWETIVLSGERTNTVVGRASNKVIREGEIVLLGTSARFSGYASTCGRTLVAGTATKGQVEYLEHGARAFELACDALEYGAPKRNVDFAARSYLHDQGLGAYQLYSVAHGTGLTECLEGEPFTQHSEGAIPKNLATMIDVGLFGHPEYFGARLEDEFAIDDEGKKHRLSDLELRLW